MHRALKHKLPVVEIHRHNILGRELAFENRSCHGIFNVLLYRPLQWPGPEHRIKANFRDFIKRTLGHRE